MIKKSQKQPSYFEGMDIGDELPIINREGIHVKFEKSSNESGNIIVDVGDKVHRAFEIEYDYDNFPTMREQFIKKIRYLFLRDFSIPDFQNDDLKDTQLNLIKHLDLGYGLKIVKTDYNDVTSIFADIQKSNGEEGEEPRNPEEILPEGTLKDFIYTIYVTRDGHQTPMGIFAIPFAYADEVYDLNTLDEIREFFIDLAETQLNAPIKELAKLRGDADTTPFERLDNGLLNSKDILDFYNAESQKFEPGSPELKTLQQNVSGLINKLHQGENVTKQDLKMSFTRPMATKRPEYVKDYRRTILMSRLNKDINKVEQMFESRIKSESDEGKIAKIRSYYFDMKRNVSDLLVEMDKTKDIQPLISDINVLLTKASDFIKK